MRASNGSRISLSREAWEGADGPVLYPWPDHPWLALRRSPGRDHPLVGGSAGAGGYVAARPRRRPAKPAAPSRTAGLCGFDILGTQLVDLGGDAVAGREPDVGFWLLRLPAGRAERRAAVERFRRAWCRER